MVSFPSSLVGFLGFHPYTPLFSFRKLFCDLFLLFFVLFFVFVSFVCLFFCLGMVREKRGGRGGQAEDAWSMKYDNVHIKLRIFIKLPVNPNITLSLSIRGF